MSGWEEMLNELVHTRRRALTAYAFLLSNDLREAEDLVQDALIAVFSRGHLTDITSAEAYVRKAILNTYLDGFRRRRRWAAIRHLNATPECQQANEAATADHIPARLDVHRALNLLSPRQRACVVLRFYEDLTIPAIAIKLSLSSGTVKRHLFDAIRRLEVELGPIPDAQFENLDEAPLGSQR